MEWVLTRDNLPDKEYEEIFCTVRLRYDNRLITSIKAYYPEEKILIEDEEEPIIGKGFGSITCEDGLEFFEKVDPVAWSYIPEHDSADWIKIQNHVPDKTQYDLLLLKADGEKFDIWYGNYYKNDDTHIIDGFYIWDNDIEDYALTDIVAWMEEPEPYRFKKPTSEELNITHWNWKNKKLDHFVIPSDGETIIKTFNELLDYAKEIYTSKKMYVYELETSSDYRYYEVEIVDRDSDPKEYFDERTDFGIKCKKLRKGSFLDEQTVNEIMSGLTAIKDGIIYSRKELNELYDQDTIDAEIIKWLTPKEQILYCRSSSGYRDFPSKTIQSMLKKIPQELDPECLGCSKSSDISWCPNKPSSCKKE